MWLMPTCESYPTNYAGVPVSPLHVGKRKACVHGGLGEHGDDGWLAGGWLVAVVLVGGWCMSCGGCVDGVG